VVGRTQGPYGTCCAALAFTAYVVLRVRTFNLLFANGACEIETDLMLAFKFSCQHLTGVSVLLRTFYTVQRP